MSRKATFLVLFACAFGSTSPAAFGSGDGAGCVGGPAPAYSDVQFTVTAPDFTQPTAPPVSFPVKAVLTQPVEWVRTGRRGGCFKLVEDPAAVVILHGSAGMDNRNAVYGNVLKRQFATLSVEMFQGSTSDSARPPLPVFNYPYAFGALNYLIDEVAADPDAVGCLGFSWGGVICNQVATELYSQAFGDALYGTAYRFAAHVANYPVCYARNVPNPENPTEPLPGSLFGTEYFGQEIGAPLTGAPLLIQVGELDAYDNPVGGAGSLPCLALEAGLNEEEQEFVDVVVFEGGQHAFDRLFAVATVVRDPTARLGAGIGEQNPENWPEVPIVPDLAITNRSLRNVLKFFRRNLLYH